jgi:hypothetical protein
MKEVKHLTHDKPHARDENAVDPKTDGPYLDDIRKAQEDAQREARNLKAVKK